MGVPLHNYRSIMKNLEHNIMFPDFQALSPTKSVEFVGNKPHICFHFPPPKGYLHFGLTRYFPQLTSPLIFAKLYERLHAIYWI